MSKNKNPINLCATVLTVVLSTSVGLAETAVPEVSSVSLTQISHRNVRIDYELANAPAVITLDIQTNAAENVWVSIGGEHIQRVSGDCWKAVEAGNRSIRWDPSVDWPGHKVADGGARAVVKAWAVDNTPDYMVVDISTGAKQNSQKYYPAVEFLPGGLLKNPDYRTTSIVMRKIMAKDVEWTMGSAIWGDTEKTHKVKMAKNYYIGVFPITQKQWEIPELDDGNGNFGRGRFKNKECYAMRPMEKVSYFMIRKAAGNWDDANMNYPNGPADKSYLGMLRRRTGLDFDLPTEAQWEFAARAGHADGFWGNGSVANISSAAFSDPDPNFPGRCKLTGGYVDGVTDPGDNCTAEHGTAIVGTTTANDWGLYDMNGNVWEWTLGGFKADITGNYTGEAYPESDAAGKVGVRGGSWCDVPAMCRNSCRWDIDANDQEKDYIGLRVICTAGLE